MEVHAAQRRLHRFPTPGGTRIPSASPGESNPIAPYRNVPSASHKSPFHSCTDAISPSPSGA